MEDGILLAQVLVVLHRRVVAGVAAQIVENLLLREPFCQLVRDVLVPGREANPARQHFQVSLADALAIHLRYIVTDLQSQIPVEVVAGAQGRHQDLLKDAAPVVVVKILGYVGLTEFDPPAVPGASLHKDDAVGEVAADLFCHGRQHLGAVLLEDSVYVQGPDEVLIVVFLHELNFLNLLLVSHISSGRCRRGSGGRNGLSCPGHRQCRCRACCRCPHR